MDSPGHIFRPCCCQQVIVLTWEQTSTKTLFRYFILLTLCEQSPYSCSTCQGSEALVSVLTWRREFISCISFCHWRVPCGTVQYLCGPSRHLHWAAAVSLWLQGSWAVDWGTRGNVDIRPQTSSACRLQMMETHFLMVHTSVIRQYITTLLFLHCIQLMIGQWQKLLSLVFYILFCVFYYSRVICHSLSSSASMVTVIFV